MLANRIDPLGQFATTPRRGGFMGNRGRLHSAEGEITRRWQTKAWITCTLREKPGRPDIGVTPPIATPASSSSMKPWHVPQAIAPVPNAAARIIAPSAPLGRPPIAPCNP